ncbi:MAG: GNAT family N-acetyltransferase [Dehalococcoidales bacterium]|nr:GNAT family N-acetyltransferase [Dehalococcoidales bacterium]
MDTFPVLQGERVLLRRPVKQDIEDRLEYGRQPEIVRMFGGDTENLPELTREEVTGWWERIASNPGEWIIEYEGKCIGNARLTVNEKDRRARYAVGIYDITKLNMGLGTEVTGLVLDYAFNTLGLHRVDLRVLEFNYRGIACFGKCGFVKEGVERDSALIDGTWETDIMMSILEDEYRDTR